MMTDLDRYRTAELLFSQRRYVDAAHELTVLLGADAPPYGVGDAPLLLARAYYHSAQLHRAEAAARGLVERDETDAYAALLLARTLTRLGRPDEARGWRRRAEALGAEAPESEAREALGAEGPGAEAPEAQTRTPARQPEPTPR